MDLDPWLPHLVATAGTAIGAALAWFLCRSKAHTVCARYEERDRAARKSVADLEAGCANLEAEVRQLRHSEAVALRRQSELELLAQTQQRGLVEKQQLLKDAETRMARNFKAMSLETLRDTQREFIKYAHDALDSRQKEATSELEQRRMAVETLVKPVATTLNKVESRIKDLERARRETETTLGEHVRKMASAQLSLQKETAQLVKALRQPSGRGRWGELQLQRVVELSGMQNYCDFYTPTEAEQSGADGLQRPNLVVNLPGNRIIAVDAHASLEAYLAAVESTDEETHQREMRRHAALVSRHLDALTTPRYAAQFNAKPEFTVLFLPGEGFLTAALGEEPDLLERGIERGIILATPSTLIALLRSAAVGWRQEGIAEKARTVSAAGRELYGHVNHLAKHIVKIGRSLDGTVRDYNAALGTLEQGVLPSTRKLSNLGIPAHPSKLPAVSRARVTEEVLTPSTDEESESVNAPV